MKDIVTYAIRSKFDDIEGINMDIGKEYQEKLIQYPIRIPCMNKDETEFYIMCLLSENELTTTEFDGLLKFLQEKRKQNPCHRRQLRAGCHGPIVLKKLFSISL